MVDDKLDVLRNSSVAVAAGIPNIGSTLSFFLDKILPSQIEKQYNIFITSLSQEVNNLQIEVNESIVHSAEFISLFNRMIDIAVRENSEEKLAIIRNILLSAITSPNTFCYNDFFNYLVDRLTIDEIRWLFFSDMFWEKNGIGPYAYLVKQKEHGKYPYIAHVATKLIRYKLLDGSKISNLGKMFIQYINSPINVFDETNKS